MDSKKSKKHTRRNSFDISGHNPEKQEQPWMMNASLKPAKSTRQVSDTTSTTSPKIVRSPRKTPNKYASKSASADVLMGDEKPEWMKSAEKLRKKKKPVINHEANNPAAPPAEDLPEWMTQRSKIQQQQQQKTSSPDEKSLRGSTNSIASTTSTANEDEQQQPAWMIQRSKIKQKTDLTPPPSPTRKTNNAGDNKPDWMKHHLVPEPRISIDDLKTSIVQEKLELREPIRQASIRLTKEELTDNVVKQKLEKRPSIVDHRKSQVKPEEMEWMKKKLKKSTATSQPETSSLKKEPADDKKPEWMKHRDKLIPRVSAQELQKSVVQEKLHSRGPIRESSLRNICKAELTDNKVMTKLAQRPAVYSTIKSIIQTENMEWMKYGIRAQERATTPDDHG
ncbi:expressed unknown protein [Seminavis robusta]|uniref:Uncharacterized protein n=1 Tax=Seminavis robusta TaxID=568900 RepID=A0A9N8EDU5_9STRA|nr:expressed unknown protein [Seminavis robusta]|eukprot:Sro800_g204220.1 n/a (394) ;mRNA; f:1177-2358